MTRLPVRKSLRDRFTWIALGSFLLASASALADSDVDVRFSADDFRPAERQLHTFNTNFLLSTAFTNIGYGSLDILLAVKEMRPTGLRFPGGTIGNNYLWEEDTFALQEDDLTKWAAQALKIFRNSGKEYGLEEWVALCLSTDIEPIYVLNVYHETPKSVVRLLNKIRDLGMDLKQIEFGNEVYWDPRSHNDVHAYIEYCKPLAKAIRDYDPEIVIGACFGPFDRRGKYESNWNAILAKEDFYDVVIHHEYYGGQGIAVDAGTDAALREVVYPDGFIAHLVAKSREYDSPDKPIWITEWNMGTKGLDRWRGTGAQLLFLGAIMQELIRESDVVSIASYHQIYRSNFGTMEFNRDTGEMEFFPPYYFMKLFGGFWSGAKTVAVHDEMNAAESDQVLSVVRKGGSIEAFVVNRSDERTTIRFAQLADKPGTLHLIECESPERKFTPNEDLLTEHHVLNAGNVRLPPFSIARLVVPN